MQTTCQRAAEPIAWQIVSLLPVGQYGRGGLHPIVAGCYSVTECVQNGNAITGPVKKWDMLL